MSFLLYLCVHKREKSMVIKSVSWKFELCRTGYDPFIDFLKGYCIVLVILNHCIPTNVRMQIGFPLWGSPAVPIFLILQVFHFYKRDFDFRKLDFGKMWKRVAKPFLIVELIILFFWQLSFMNNDGEQPSIKDCLYLFAGGAGSYYPWVYLQFAILLPLLRPLFRLNNSWRIFVFLLLSQLAEVLCAVCDMPEWIYRLTFFRYLFLIYLGELLASKGLVLNGKTMLIVVVSILSTVVFVYYHIGDNPLTYHVDAWSTCHWICYFYMVYLVMFLIKFIYSCIQNSFLVCYFKQIGKYSYEIYIFQLFYFTCVSPIILKYRYIGDSLLVYVFLSTILCIVPVIMFQQIKSKRESQKR